MSSYPLLVFHDGLSELQAAEVFTLSEDELLLWAHIFA